MFSKSEYCPPGAWFAAPECVTPLPADFRVVCAWCGAHMAGNPNAQIISHGICPGCARDVIEEDKRLRGAPCAA
jgi:hypothetical protein